ncbi:MAG: hypothetical protein Kow00109_24680 [Acidobacteriota bacterium]
MPRLSWFCLLLSAVLPAPEAAAAARHFFYLSDHRIATVELVDETSLLLNYINLDDSYELLRAPDLVLVDRRGQVFRGHLFEFEQPPKPEERFRVTQLVRPGEFQGLLVRGKLTVSGVEKVLLRLGSRLLQLEPQDPREFEVVASRVANIDLAEKDRKLALQLAGFRRGYGEMRYSGDPDGAEWLPYFTEEETLPPIPVATPSPRLPSSARELPQPVVVQVRAFVTKAGGIQGVEVVQGVEPRLDRIAVQTVENSWVFLPAVAGNEVANAELKLNVVFQDTGQRR